MSSHRESHRAVFPWSSTCSSPVLTIDGLKEQVRPEAETRIKSSLVLEQIAKEENIEVSEDEINAES